MAGGHYSNTCLINYWWMLLVWQSKALCNLTVWFQYLHGLKDYFLNICDYIFIIPINWTACWSHAIQSLVACIKCSTSELIWNVTVWHFTVTFGKLGIFSKSFRNYHDSSAFSSSHQSVNVLYNIEWQLV